MDEFEYPTYQIDLSDRQHCERLLNVQLGKTVNVPVYRTDLLKPPSVMGEGTLLVRKGEKEPVLRVVVITTKGKQSFDWGYDFFLKGAIYARWPELLKK